MICPAFLARNDVIDFKMMLLEMLLATSAIAALFSVKVLAIEKRVVPAYSAYVIPGWYIYPMLYIAEKALPFLYPFDNQFSRLL